MKRVLRKFLNKAVATQIFPVGFILFSFSNYYREIVNIFIYFNQI